MVHPVLSLSFIALVAVLYSLMVMAATFAQNRIGDESRIPIYLIRFTVGGFLLVTGLLALQGVFLDFQSMPPKIFLAILPAFVGMLVLAFNRRTTRWLREMPLGFLILPQAFRIFVEIQLYYLSETPLLPKLMTFEGRNFDIVVGLTAPVIGHFVHHAKTPAAVATWKKVALIWNIAGILILTNVVVHGILSVPTQFQHFVTDPPNTAMGHFPFIWLPAFLVPFAYLLHILCLRKIALKHPEM